jgi:hypothetical protein
MFLGFHAQTLEIFDVPLHFRFGSNAARFSPGHSRKDPFSGMSLILGDGKPRLAGHEKTSAKHHFGESWPRWPV